MARRWAIALWTVAWLDAVRAFSPVRLGPAHFGGMQSSRVLPRRPPPGCCRDAWQRGALCMALPTLVEAGDVVSLAEGMRVNVLEHREEIESSQNKYQLKLGDARPPTQSFPAPISLPPPEGMDRAVELLKVSDGAIFTAEECKAIMDEAEAREEWVIGGDWHKDQAFPGIDLPVEKLPRAMEFLRTALPCRLFPFVAAALPELCTDANDLRLSDLFLVKYDGKLGQTGLRTHQDKGIISVNIALNGEAEYEGGGTLIPCLDRVAKIPKGSALVHSSSMWHAGHPISAGTRVIMVIFLISTASVEHKRRFMERGAMLRNKGMLQAGKRALLMARQVQHDWHYSEDLVHDRVSALGMPAPWRNQTQQEQLSSMIAKVDELWAGNRGRVRLLALLRLQLGVLLWLDDAFAPAFDQLYLAGMHEYTGEFVQYGTRQAAEERFRGSEAVEASGLGFSSLSPIAWALLAGVCADGAKDSVLHWRCLSGSTSSTEMNENALDWYRRAVEESGEGGFVASNCDVFTQSDGDAAQRIKTITEFLDVNESDEADLSSGLSKVCNHYVDTTFQFLTGGMSLMQWGEIMYQVVDQSDNAVAFYLEAEPSEDDVWQREKLVQGLDKLISELTSEQGASQGASEARRLQHEAHDPSPDARYLRSDLCRTSLEVGALLEKQLGPGAGEEAFLRAVLFDANDEQARAAVRFAQEDKGLSDKHPA